MAVRLDERARAAIARRGARGQETALTLQIAPVPHGGHRLSAAWVPRRGPDPRLVERRVGEQVVYVDERVARYAHWHDVTISAWHLAALDFLVVVNEPLVMRALAAWSHTHPGLPHAAATRARLSVTTSVSAARLATPSRPVQVSTPSAAALSGSAASCARVARPAT